MYLRLRLLPGVMLAAISAIGPVNAFPQEPHKPRLDITEEMRRQDPRLEKPLSITAPRTYCGDLLDQISLASGISVVGDNTTGSSDEPLFVFFRKERTADVLNTVRSLFSYRDAEWSWVREGESPNYTYRLVRSRPARELGGRLRDWSREAFANQALTLARIARATPEQRKQMGKQLQTALYLSDSDFEKYRAKLLDSDAPWIGLNLFSEALSAEEQAKTLRGDPFRPVPISTLREPAARLARALWPGLVSDQSSKRPASLVDPELVLRFQVRNERGDAIPALFALLRKGNVEYGTQIYACDALSEWFNRMMAGRWRLDGEKPECDKLANRLTNGPGLPAPAEGTNLQLEAWLTEVARRSNCSVAARLPARRTWFTDQSFGLTLESCLSRLSRMPIVTKWRGETLLLTSTTWPDEELARVPLRVVRQLRADASKHGALSLEDICSAAAQLRPEQLQELAGEFSELGHAARFRPLLALLHTQPDLLAMAQRPAGAALNDELGEALSAVPDVRPAVAAARTDASGQLALKARTIDDRSSGRLKRTIMFEIVGQEHSFGGAGFDYGPATRPDTVRSPVP